MTPEPAPPEKAPMGKLKKSSNKVFTNIINPQQRIAIDLTGWLLVTPNKGNKYWVVL